jgi:hypothetical protein
VQPVFSPPPVSPAAGIPGLRKLGTGTTDAAAGDDPRFTATANLVANIAALRAFSGTPSINQVYFTSGGLIAGDGGGMQYRWNPIDTAADDGVLHIKVGAIVTGRFNPFTVGRKIFPILAAVPAAADGSRTVSFDPTYTIAIGTEMYRITSILRNTKWQGISIQPGRYMFSGAEVLAPSPGAFEGFDIIFEPGAVFAGPSHGPTTSSAQWSIYAECYGDAPGASTIIQDNNANKPHWTQTFKGYELTLTGVSDVVTDGLAAGQTVALYLGGETTDAGGWCGRWAFAEISSVTVTSSPVGNITLTRPIPGSMQTGSTINSAPRNVQTYHTLKRMQGFQDNVRIIGGRLDNVFLAPAGVRNLWIDSEWDYCTFGLNAFMCQGIVAPRLYGRVVTGYNNGGGGAGAHYGGFIALQSCYGTKIGSLIVENLDGVFLIDDELTCTGTTVESLDVTVNGANAVGHTAITIGASSTEIGTAVVRGGSGFIDFSTGTRIGLAHFIIGDTSPGTTDTVIVLQADNVDKLIFRDRTYQGKKRRQFSVPVRASLNTITTFPFYGVCTKMRIFPSTLTGITSWLLTPVGGGTQNVLSLGVSAGVWNDVSTSAGNLGSLALNSSPNQSVMQVVGNGSVPAGAYMTVDVVYFELEPSPAGLADSTVPEKIGGSGHPTASAAFIGQEYTDFSSATPTIYVAVGTGNGSSDWVYTSFATPVALAGLLGTSVPITGTAIPDADSSVSISGGSHYVMATASAARAVTLLDTGSPVTGETIVVDVTRLSSSTVTIKDSTAATLFAVPPLVQMKVKLTFNGTHFVFSEAIRIAT